MGKGEFATGNLHENGDESGLSLYRKGVYSYKVVIYILLLKRHLHLYI